jgi:hypothetical protein
MTEKMTKGAWIKLAALLIGAAACAVVLGSFFSKPETYSYFTASLDAKKAAVEKMTAGATGASAALTLVPGDFGTPVATKLVDLSGWFIVILCVIYAEKFLVTIAGWLVFKILIPVGLVLIGMGDYAGARLTEIGKRLIALGIILGTLVPISIVASNMIENQYQTEIQQTVDSAAENSTAINGTAERTDDTDSDSPWSQFISKINGGSQALLNKVENLLSDFIDVVAIYMVTTCVIPVLVFIVMVWLIKMLFHLRIMQTFD